MSVVGGMQGFSLPKSLQSQVEMINEHASEVQDGGDDRESKAPPKKKARAVKAEPASTEAQDPQTSVTAAVPGGSAKQRAVVKDEPAA